MKRTVTTGALLLLAPIALRAQEWNSDRALAIARHATEVRAAQLGPGGLTSYKAEAHGYLTFLAQFGQGFPEPPKIVRSDEIASDVYWRAPSSSKQLVKGRRDTLLLPTDIRYHRDHLGIVQNNFPSIIRVGDGDEVSDVPHPLSAQGLALYDFAIADSLQIRIGPRTLDVLQLRYKPKDPHAPRAVGSVYIDRETGAVVQMSIGFTRAALRDPELEDLSVILVNGLIDGRYWLPRSQEIEIRRTGTWLDYPARGIIRGRWEISDYDVNVPVDWVFDSGPEIELAPGGRAPREGVVTSPGFKFTGNILDSLPPDVGAFASADVAKLRSEVSDLVSASALARTQQLALAAHGVSDFIRFNRVEGIAAGGAATIRPAPQVALGVGASYAFSLHELEPHGSVSWTGQNGATVAARAYHTLADASIVPERSGVINSLAAQEFASDYTDLYRNSGASLTLALPRATLRPSLELAAETQDSVGVHATPASGHFRPGLPATPLSELRATFGVAAPSFTIDSFAGSASLSLQGMRDRLAGGGNVETFGRATVLVDATRQYSSSSLVLSGIATSLTGASVIPAQHLALIGGPVTAPGYDMHQFAGTRALAMHAEWRFRVPFIGVPLGAWGTAPATLTAAPYIHDAWIDGAGWHPSVGLGVLTIFDLLRFDVARGLIDGRWTFNVDVSPTFWRVL